MAIRILVVKKVLPHIHQLWGRTIHMESIVESKGIVFSDGASKICVKPLGVLAAFFRYNFYYFFR